MATGKSVDADAGRDPQLQNRLQEIRERLGEIAENAAWEQIAERSITSIVDAVNLQFESELETITGITPLRQEEALRSIVEETIQQQVSLIRTLPRRHFEDIEDKVMKAVDEGWSTERLSDTIPRTGQTARFNATRIARDQTGRVTGEITKQRHTQSGLKTAVWDTVGDDRVREDHEALNGTVFQWDDGAGPAGIIPGEEIMCRCTAQVNFNEASSKFQAEAGVTPI